MIGVGLWCFATAPKEHGYPLVELLANESLREDVEIPSHCIANVMHFIFNSGIPRSTRERLLLRIVDVDYKDEIMLEDYVCACVGAGFVSALKRTYNGRVEYESFVTAILLSDTPDDAFAFLESVTNESHDEARDAIVTRFRALLFLNARRFIRLLLKSFPELHPSCIQNMRDTKVVIHYYDALFEEQKFGDDADSRFYVRYLADQSVEDLVKLLRRKELSADWTASQIPARNTATLCGQEATSSTSPVPAANEKSRLVCESETEATSVSHPAIKIRATVPNNTFPTNSLFLIPVFDFIDSPRPDSKRIFQDLGTKIRISRRY